jgi:putative ABC transport system substrate-binding protein
MQFDHLKRRDFIALLGGTAAIWPFAAGAQSDQVRHLGVLMSTGERDPETAVRLAAFRDALQKLGWTEGRNLRSDYRWGGGDADRTRAYAADLVALKPDVIFGAPASAGVPLRRETRTIPIVFAQTPDPVGLGLVGGPASRSPSRL